LGNWASGRYAIPMPFSEQEPVLEDASEELWKDGGE
jgi:endogenous inhibitor of DNA gyrase (YacG/DUF329 family)